MTEIQGKSILVRVSARFELARVRVIGSRLYLSAAESFELDFKRFLNSLSKDSSPDDDALNFMIAISQVKFNAVWR